MRVRGDNAPPNAFTIEAQPKKPGYVLVRFFENVQQFEETQGELTISGYEYDEYSLEMESTDGLQDSILDSFNSYLTEAKLKEAEEKVIPNLEQQVEDLTQENTVLSQRVTELDTNLSDTQMALCDVYETVLGGVV